MSFITDQQLFDQVGATLHKAQIDIKVDTPWWTTIISRANLTAYAFIYRELAKRFYTPAQIAAWDEGPEYNYSLGTYWALDYGQCLGSFDDRMVTKLDRRGELKTVEIVNAGIWQTPGGTYQAVNEGESNYQGMFSKPEDPCDPRINQVMRF